LPVLRCKVVLEEHEQVHQSWRSTRV
jgi:hypothetical protein